MMPSCTGSRPNGGAQKKKGRRIVQTFKYILTEYLIYMQLSSQEVAKRTAELESMCLSFILRISISAEQAARPSTLTRMLPIQARRKILLLKTVAKFHKAVKDDPENGRQRREWNKLETYTTYAPFVKETKPPIEGDEIQKWTK